MKKKISFKSALMSLMTCLLVAFSIGEVAAFAFGADPVDVAVKTFAVPAVIYAVHYIVTGKNIVLPGMMTMAIQQEIWVNYIIENLFKDNEFLTKCFDESDHVLAGAVCHIPQAGAASAVVKNRSVFPAVAVRRTDTDITYPLDVYSTDPRHITNAEANEISYDKMNSCIGEDTSAVLETMSDDILYKWCPTTTGQIVRTTGAASATALAPSATGTRLTFVKENLKSAQKIMNKQKIAKTDRYALMPTDLLSQLMEDTTLLNRDGIFGGEVDLKNGIVARLYGFNIMERSDTTIYDAATPPQPKAPGAAGASTDNLAVICWQKNAVAKALGSVKAFENINDALHYGDVFSMEVKAGGRKRRTNGEGVVAIVQE